MSLRSRLKKVTASEQYEVATNAQEGSWKQRASLFEDYYNHMDKKPAEEPKLRFTHTYRARTFDKNDTASNLRQGRSVSDELVIDDLLHPLQSRRHVAGEHQGLASLEYNCGLVLNELTSNARKTPLNTQLIRNTIQKHVDIQQVPVYVVVHTCLAQLGAAPRTYAQDFPNLAQLGPWTYAQDFPNEREHLEAADLNENMYWQRVRNALRTFPWVPSSAEEQEKVLVYIFLLEMRDNTSLLELWLHLKELVKRYCSSDAAVSKGCSWRLEHERQELQTCFGAPHVEVLRELLLFFNMTQSPDATRMVDIYRDAMQAAWPLPTRVGFEPVLKDTMQRILDIPDIQNRHAILDGMERDLRVRVGDPSAEMLLIFVRNMLVVVQLVEQQRGRKRDLSYGDTPPLVSPYKKR